jgi:transposase
MKYAAFLSSEYKIMLQDMWHYHPISRCRQRAHAILLSARNYSIPQIAEILEVERRAVSAWIDGWEAQGLLGLYDKPRCGRPPIFTDDESILIEQLTNEEPRQLKRVLAKMKERTGKSASCITLKRVLKNSIIRGNVVGNQ